jgi:hypothetical protein
MSTHLPLTRQPLDAFEAFQHRRPLLMTARAIAEGGLIIGLVR